MARRKRHTYYRTAKGARIEKSPHAPGAHELIEGATSQEQIDRYILRLMFGEMGGDLNKLQWLERVFDDPAGSVNVPQYRPYVAKVLQKFLDMLHSDSMFRTRVIFLQQRLKGQRTGVNECVAEEVGTSVVEMPERPYLKVLKRHRETGTLHDELEILARDADRRFNLDGFREKLRAGLREIIPADAKA
jgi:hypothetical protein